MEQFEFILPMKAQLSDISFLRAVSNDLGWVAGEKFDGYREIVYLGRERNEMYSSLGTSHIDKVPQFKTLVPHLAGTVIDCEGLSPTRYVEDNASCFKADACNTIAWQNKYGMASLVAFDILAFRGRPVMHEPFEHRRPLLESVVYELQRHCYWNTQLRIEQLVYHHKLDYYQTIVAREQNEGHEGIILKRLDGLYHPGSRGPAWLKIKREETVIATITGFTPGCGKYEGLIGSVMFKTDGVQGTASGMDDQERVYMSEHPEAYIGKKAKFVGQSITRYGALRHPRYQGLMEEEG